MNLTKAFLAVNFLITPGILKTIEHFPFSASLFSDASFVWCNSDLHSLAKIASDDYFYFCKKVD